MSDPLAAVSSTLPLRTRDVASTPSQIYAADTSLSSPPIEALKSRAIQGKIAQHDSASLRWIQWKLFLTKHISSTPSSWSAVIKRDRDAYNELRCRLLRAPDGNYPPEVGFDGTHTTLGSAAATNQQDPHASSARVRPAVVNDLSVNNPLSLDDSNPWKTYYNTLETRRVILQDVERTFPELDLFRVTSVQQSLTNILFLWTLENEDVGYRQGMHELAAVLWKIRSDGAVEAHSLSSCDSSHASTRASADAPFQHALADVFIEHDVYALYCALMQSAKSWYAWRDSPSAAADSAPSSSPSTSARPLPNSRNSPEGPRHPLPIVAKCEYILELLRHIDPALAQHLQSLGIEPQLFCLRWIRVIFTREFALDDALAIWDGLFASEASLHLIDYVCIAMLLRIRNQLLGGDHSSALQSLLRYPTEAQAQPPLLIKQAIFMRGSGLQPSTGVAVVMQNRDLLGIPARSVDDPAQSSSPAPHTSASSSQRHGAQKFATVGRTPSGAAGRASPWSRLQDASATPRNGTNDSRKWQLPAMVADPPGASSADTNGHRAFGINPSAYLPEGISDIAKGWYERAELPQTLNSALANVSKTVAAAASAYGAQKVEPSGFPSGFDQAFASQTAPRSTAPPTTVGHATSGKTRSKLPVVKPERSTPPPAQRSSAELVEHLGRLSTANKAIGTALSVCINVLEQSWLDRAAGGDKHYADELSDINTSMSFTALKHIRDVLDGTTSEFDPAALPESVSKRLGSDTSERKQTVKKKQSTFPVETVSKQDSAPAKSAVDQTLTSPSSLPISLTEYARYGRQMILPDFGLPGQLRLRNAKVLVVGAGGLGCPAVQYLAAAGVGQISILDHDVVEASNLARQILHSDATVGMHKAVSAAKAAELINPYINAVPIAEAISASNARHMIRGQDLVLDCTDNPLTRYLISDAAVLEGIQVVSGAAQGYDGQLVVLHKRIKPEFAGPEASASASVGDVRGPCYRCLFPKAPRPDEVTNCEDGGVLGGVTGLVGTMQALESVKILAGIGEDTPPMLTLVSPLTSTPFRCVKIRPRRIATCRSCGDPSQVTASEPMITNLEIEDYVSFCGLNATAGGDGDLRRTDVTSMDPKALVVDVRPTVEYGITKLDGSLNLPIQQLLKDPKEAWERVQVAQRSTSAPSVLVVCKKGNDSKLAVKALLRQQKEWIEQQEKAEEIKALPTAPSHPLGLASDLTTSQSTEVEAAKDKAQFITALQITDLIGGLRTYSKEKNPSFPIY
ncbi:related to molybdenum cofactor biosynthetic protein [Melanopsichium pennsylvanicum]|uniref:Related to molybdenum cofactor biosynthetic protein n=1 Tax=Melanopsichium pennsylvanicum TaxID=63383 RepID=A0AAJ4XM48_9BASI|nr:related to molybdenum cofactor biosynthetic protein [Melanopsichium pennsylvanicum]